jgi:hypothetical protein
MSEASVRCLKKERAAMFNKTIWFSLILSLTSVVLAQEGVQPNPTTIRVGADSSHATQACQVTYTSGNFNTTGTQFCVTVNGNIPQFSVRGNQLFPPEGNAADLEGYGFCDLTANQRYFDYAGYDNGLWNASTLQQNGKTVTVTRTTADGNWQLTQTIVNVAATASAVGSAKVTMKLKNLSGVDRVANLLRYAAEDIGFVSNDYNTTQYSATGQFPFGAGLMITVNSFPHGFLEEAFVQNIQSGPDPCSPFNQDDTSLPYVGLGSIVAVWTGKGTMIAPGAAVTVTSTYRGF